MIIINQQISVSKLSLCGRGEYHSSRVPWSPAAGNSVKAVWLQNTAEQRELTDKSPAADSLWPGLCPSQRSNSDTSSGMSWRHSRWSHLAGDMKSTSEDRDTVKAKCFITSMHRKCKVDLIDHLSPKTTGLLQISMLEQLERKKRKKDKSALLIIKVGIKLGQKFFFNLICLNKPH